ncbi:MAG: GAF domain-containing protein [Bacteroidales bacterium]|nr:GAF domain-containing protein [Bacteroidales bacterium]
MMSKKQGRYERLTEQIRELLKKSPNPQSEMATVVAILHNKMPEFFWTGFYLLNESGDLCVNTYQGSVACQVLQKNVGVCWACINQQKPVVVDNVHEFEGHIACDSRTNSEIVIPVFSKASGKVVGCLDIDSEKLSTFDADDAEGLTKIVGLLTI